MRQANTIKRTPVTPLPTKNRFEVPLSQPPATKEDLHKKIAEKAYELYLKRNGGPGSAEEDWAKAEKIVKGL